MSRFSPARWMSTLMCWPTIPTAATISRRRWFIWSGPRIEPLPTRIGPRPVSCSVGPARWPGVSATPAKRSAWPPGWPRCPDPSGRRPLLAVHSLSFPALAAIQDGGAAGTSPFTRNHWLGTREIERSHLAELCVLEGSAGRSPPVAEDHSHDRAGEQQGEVHRVGLLHDRGDGANQDHSRAEHGQGQHRPEDEAP